MLSVKILTDSLGIDSQSLQMISALFLISKEISEEDHGAEVELTKTVLEKQRH